MTLHICVLIPGFFDGGAQKQCIFLLNELRRRENVTVTLIYFHDGVHDDLLEREGIDIHRFSVSSNYNPLNVLKIRSLLKEIRPDILMTWLHSCDVYGFFLRRAVPGLRWVMTERDSFYPVDPRYILRKFLGRYADAIVANSEKGAHYWMVARARGTIAVIANIVQTSTKPIRPGSQSRIVSIGRLEPQKNTRTVVEAFSKLAMRRCDLTFAIIGDGSQRGELEAFASQTNGGDRINFLGFRKDVPEQIQSASLVVSASHHEGMPNVMLESIAGNRPVVVSDIPEHRELFGPKYPFYVEDRTDAHSFVSAMERAIADPDPVAHLSYARTQLEAMTPNVIADKYVNLFMSIAGKK